MSKNPGTLTFWILLGHSKPVTGLLYLIIIIIIIAIIIIITIDKYTSNKEVKK